MEGKPEHLSTTRETKSEGSSSDGESNGDGDVSDGDSQLEREERERHVSPVPDSDDDDDDLLSPEGEGEQREDDLDAMPIDSHLSAPPHPLPHPEVTEDNLLDAVVIQVDRGEVVGTPTAELDQHPGPFSDTNTSVDPPIPSIPPLYSSDPLEFHFSDDQSEAMNGRDRDSVDSGFGSADEVDMLNSSSGARGNGGGYRRDGVGDHLIDDIEEYEDSNGEGGIVVDDSDDEEESQSPGHSYDPISLVRPFKKFLGTKRSSKTNPTAKEDDNIATAAEETELATLSSHTTTSGNSSSKPSLLLPWRRNAQLHVEVEEKTSPRQENNKSVFSRARTLSVDLGLLTGGADKKEKKSSTSQLALDSPATPAASGEPYGTPTRQHSDDHTHPPPTEERAKTSSKKLGGMLSISNSLRKLTKGIGRSTASASSTAATAPTVESVTSYLCNDEPISKFTPDGIPLYWVGYQETQFIALQPWQILLLPIVYQTERYYDSALVPPLSPFHGLEESSVPPPESVFSPASALSGS
jgi:hypothetical protein